MYRCIFIFTLLVVCALSKASTDVSAMFAERAKCAVAIKYIFQLEEDRNQFFTSGMVVDESGLIIVANTEMPDDARVESLLDFKVFIFGGDQAGYPADYLGADFITGTHFLRIRGGLPKCMVSYKKFPKARAKISQDLWGVALTSEQDMFEPFYMRSYVSIAGRRPLLRGETFDSVAAVGTAIFDMSGNFVGWGQSQTEKMRIAHIDESRQAPILLQSPGITSSFLFPEEVEDLLKRVPSKPSGDAYAWAGLWGIQMLKHDVAKILGLEHKSALVVSEVIKKSPADKAGIEKGDIIIGLNGADIERLNSDSSTLANFSLLLRKRKVGDTVSLSIIRNSDAPKDFKIKLEARPKSMRESQFKYFKRLGFSIREFLMDDAIMRKMDDIFVDTAVAQFVRQNSPASSAMPNKLAEGDIIKEINSTPVSSYADAVKILSKINDDSSVKSVVILAEDFNETKVVRIKLD